VLREPGWTDLVDKLAGAAAAGVGAPTVAESGLVLTAKMGRRAPAVLSRFLQEASLDVIPVAEAHWRVAVDACARFGKNRHPANLNFGDCLTCAIARLADRPLLFVGDDCSKTDLPAA
jgi:ribonuclease VapC